MVTCTISYEKAHRLFEFGFRFVAKATGPDGVSIVVEGQRFRSDFVDYPHEEDSEAQAAYASIEAKLLADGWEYCGPEGLWCCTRFQRDE